MAEVDYLSEVMNKILDSLGLYEENRQRRMRVKRVIQMLDRWRWESINNISGFPLYAGSNYETTTIDGLSSDMDYLVIPDTSRVIHNIEQWILGDERLTYMIDEEDCYPSYVKLYRIAPHYQGPLYQEMMNNIPPWYIVNRDGKLYLSSHLTINFQIKCGSCTQSHGPALKKYADVDNVLAYQCDFFPRSALKWNERQTVETLSRVGESIIKEANHCHVVPVGNKSSPNVSLEWRYSFTHIERQLVHAWNNVQYKLYVMMKFILKDIIEPFVPGVISSYHIKTILFWMNEEYEREFFEISNFNQCILTYLTNLLDTVKRQSLPHYFIEECNLYYNKMDQRTAQQLTNIIQEIIDTWPRKLCDIKRRHLGSSLYYVLSAKVTLQTISGLINNERRRIAKFEMPSELNNLFSIIDDIKKEIMYNTTAISEVESLLNIINQNVKFITSDMEVKNFLEDFTGDSLCDAAIHYLIRSSVTQNKTETSNTIKTVTFIQRYVNHCCIDTRLKVAAFLVFTGDFQGGTVLLDRIARQMKQYTFHSCYHISCEQYFHKPYIETIYDNRPTLSEYIIHYRANPVEYDTEMIGHLPKALVYEMFRSTSVSPSPSYPDDDFKWHQHAIIQSPVFMYFLRYVIAKSKRQYTETKGAIDSMKRTSKQHEIAQTPHCETNHNIIGHCHMESGDSRSAFREYKKSLNVKKHHNTAIWQIAVLLRRNIRGDQ